MRNKMVEQGFKVSQLWRKNSVRSSKYLRGLGLSILFSVNKQTVRNDTLPAEFPQDQLQQSTESPYILRINCAFAYP